MEALTKEEAAGNILFDPLKQLPASLNAEEKAQLATGYREGLRTIALPEFLNHVATAPEFALFKTEAEVLDGYRALESRVLASVPKLFGRVPRTRFEIRPTEAFRAATASVEYISGSADGKRPGTFYVPIVDATKLRTFGEKAMGAQFPLRAFHDEILREGALPLAVLDAHLRAWMKRPSGR